MNFTKILTFAIIAMFLLVPFASAKQEVADSVKQDKKIDEKVTDKTKESAKEISNKDKDIKGKVTVTDSDSSKYIVEKKSKTEISISKSEVQGEHTKSKVTFAKEDLQKIDVDGDKLYGVLHIADDGSTSHDVYTESQLTSGTEMVFSENIVNGYSGYYEKTQTGVTSGTTIDIPDASGNYYITTSVDGSIPTYAPGIPTDGLIAKYTMDNISGSILIDEFGRDHNGTITNTTSVTIDGKKNMYFSGTSRIGINPGNSTNYTIYGECKVIPPNAGRRIFTLARMATGSKMFLEIGPTNASTFSIYNGTATISVTGTNSYSQKYVSFAVMVNDTKMAITENGILVASKTLTTPMTALYDGTNSFIGNGPQPSVYSPLYGYIKEFYIYNKYKNINSVQQMYTGGSGISFQPEPSYNFTGYDVASGVEKIIDTDATCTGLEYIDTTGGTHTVTVRIYFTEDITKTTETKGAVYQNVSIIHTQQKATASVGTIAYELDPLYSGTPVLTSNNTNATVSRNDTHAIISTGLVKQGQSFSYAISVADDHDHGIHVGEMMEWVGTGWDFVNTAPEDWDNYIGDQIEVTVS